jgi:hypothetical protein
MKRLFIFTAFLLSATYLSAQTIMMNIYEKNSVIQRIPLSDIDSITYEVINIPVVSTSAVDTTILYEIITGGLITNDGNAPIIAKGICWSTSPSPTLSNNITRDSITGSTPGLFSSRITGITSNTTYYIRAYATNIAGTGYGNEISFTTKSLLSANEVLITDFDGNGAWTNPLPLGGNTQATSGIVSNSTTPVPGAHSPTQYWKMAGTTNGGYYLEGIDIDGGFNFSLTDSIVFFAHNRDQDSTRIFVTLYDQKTLAMNNGNGEAFAYEIKLPPRNYWQRFAVGINQLASSVYFNYPDPGLTQQYYPSLAAVTKLNLIVNSTAPIGTLEIDVDDIKIVRVP